MGRKTKSHCHLVGIRISPNVHAYFKPVGFFLCIRLNIASRKCVYNSQIPLLPPGTGTLGYVASLPKTREMHHRTKVLLTRASRKESLLPCHTSVKWRGHRGSHNCHTQEYTQLSHTGVSGNTTVTCRGHRGSHNCHTQEPQAVAQILHGEIKGVTQREENNKINIHRNVFPIGFVGVIAFAA